MTTTQLETLGHKVRNTRKALGLTQEELAELAGLSYRPIYLIEDGRSVRLETLLKILDALGLELTIKPKSPHQNG